MGFNKLFWGLLFMFDFRINRIDILPDFIGYILILSGLNILQEESEYFQSAKKYAILLIFLSLPSIWGWQIDDAFRGGLFAFVFFVGIVVTVLYIVLINYICKGISEMALRKENYTLDESANKRWSYFLVVEIASLILLILSILVPQIALFIAIPLLIASLVILILLMNLMKMAQEEL